MTTAWRVKVKYKNFKWYPWGGGWAGGGAGAL